MSDKNDDGNVTDMDLFRFKRLVKRVEGLVAGELGDALMEAFVDMFPDSISDEQRRYAMRMMSVAAILGFIEGKYPDEFENYVKSIARRAEVRARLENEK